MLITVHQDRASIGSSRGNQSIHKRKTSWRVAPNLKRCLINSSVNRNNSRE